MRADISDSTGGEGKGRLLGELKRLLKEAPVLARRGEETKARKLLARGKKLALEAGLQEDALVFQASLLRLENKFDEMVRVLVPVVESPGLHLRGYAYVRLGFAQDELKQYDAAIISYSRALDDPLYDTPGKAWNNMGNAYAEKGEFDKAILCYRKALDSPNYETPGKAWYNMGLAYFNKGSFEEAIECLRKAIDSPEYDTPKDAWEKINAASAKLGLTQAAEEAAAMAEGEGIPKADPLNRIMDIMGDDRNKLAEYAAKPGTHYSDVLVILAGWPSVTSTESLLDGGLSQRLTQGGACFIKTSGQGILIDPGFDSLRYFSEMGFHIREVTQVISSHRQRPSYQELENLAYLADQWRNYDTAAKERIPIQFYFDLSTYKDHPLEDVADENIHPLEPGQPRYSLPGDIELKPFETKGSLKSSFGFWLEARLDNGQKRCIGYTSDTGFFPELCTKLADCDVIIANLSDSSVDDIRDNKLSEDHLGYTGLLKLVQGTNAKLYIVSDFRGGAGDARIELVQKLAYDLKKDKRKAEIIPGDVGCLLDLRDLKILCSSCGEFTSHKRIAVSKPDAAFGRLRYLCKNCLLG